jgi:hypothetical protein
MGMPLLPSFSYAQPGIKAAGKAIPGIFAAAARDDVRAALHVRLRGIQIARIEGGEDHIAVLVGQRADAVDIFLVARFHVERRASCRHFVEHRLAFEVLGCPNRFQQMSGANSRNLQALQGPENEMSDVGGRSFLFL